MAKLRMPPNCIDATEQYRGTVITLVGAEVFRKQITERRAAIHEAAHAVCGRILGFACGGAAITNDGTGSATVDGVLTGHQDLIRRGAHQDFRSSVLDKLMVCLAGPEAERVKFGDADARGDMRQIKRLQSRYSISDADVERLRPQVHALLLRHWDKVEVVATALLERGTLSGEAIAGLTG